MSLTRKENKLNPFVVFDIGSASVGAALILDPKNSSDPEILYSTRVPIVLQKPLIHENFFTAMLSALKNAANNIEQDGIRRLGNGRFYKKDIKDVFCVLTSSWHVAGVNTFKFQKEDPFTVSPEFISNIIKGADKNFKESLKKQFDEKDIKNPLLIEERIIQILLNGYNTDKPYNKKVNSIEATLFMSMVSENIHNNIENILEKTFSVADISFNTFTLASFSVVRDVFSTEKNFLLIDISGEVTDITLVRNETIIKMSSFPLGRNFLIRKIAEYLNTIPEEAHSIMRLFLDGKSTERELERVEKILVDVKEEWLKDFRKILADFSEELSLPKTIFFDMIVNVLYYLFYLGV